MYSVLCTERRQVFLKNMVKAGDRQYISESLQSRKLNGFTR